MPQRRRAQSGFTLVELLITLTLMAVLLLLAVAPLDKFMHRGKLEGIARQTATLMQLARFEAIKRSVPARVVADGAKDEVFAYADLDDDGAFNAANDRELGRYKVPNGVSFLAKTGTEEDDKALWHMLGSGPEQWVEFTRDGSVLVEDDTVDDPLPALRFADTRENYLEVNIAARATGRVEVRKWDEGAPTGDDGTKYVTQGQYGRSWKWF